MILNATVVDEGDLSPLVELKSLRTVRLFGDLGGAVAELRKARPDIDVAWSTAGAAPGERVGVVFLRPPTREIPAWWKRGASRVYAFLLFDFPRGVSWP